MKLLVVKLLSRVVLQEAGMNDGDERLERRSFYEYILKAVLSIILPKQHWQNFNDDFLNFIGEIK